MVKTIRNLTGRTVTIVNEQGNIVGSYPPDLQPPAILYRPVPEGKLNSKTASACPVWEAYLEGLPDEEDNVLNIVDAQVFQAGDLDWREDLIMVGPPYWNSAGEFAGNVGVIVPNAETVLAGNS